MSLIFVPIESAYATF